MPANNFEMYYFSSEFENVGDTERERSAPQRSHRKINTDLPPVKLGYTTSMPIFRNSSSKFPDEDSSDGGQDWDGNYYDLEEE